MRWIKHLTTAHDDEAICVLIEEMGAEAYGIYWLLLEHLGQGIERDSDAVPARSHSCVKWAEILHCSVRTFRKFAERAAELKLISSSSLAGVKQFSSRLPADRQQIAVPNLLKYRDEYSNKSRQTSAVNKKESRYREEGEENPLVPPFVAPAEATKPKAEKTAHGTRLQLTELPDEWKAWAISDCGWDEFKALRVWENFKDYWAAAAGAKARRADWLATWRNWCRKDRESAPGLFQPAVVTRKSSASSILERMIAGEEFEL